MSFTPKAVNGECREFVVLSPKGAQFDKAAVQNRITEALHEAFPDSGFTVLRVSEPEDEFMIIPVVEEVDGVRAARLPHADMLSKIDAFLVMNFADARPPTIH